LDWRVRLEGELVAGVEIVLPPLGDQRERSVRVPRGETIVPGVGPARPAEPAPVAHVRFEPAPEWVARVPSGTEAGPHEVSLVIEQLLGAEIVNRNAASWSFVPCELPEACDTVTLHDNQGTDSAVVLLDAPRAGGCVGDRVSRAASQAPVGDLRPNPGCRSELGVFSDGDAVSWQEDVSVWTEGCDAADVELAPILEAPATFFLAVPDWVAIPEWGVTVDLVAKQDLDEANQLYDVNKAGISFGMDVRELGVLDALALLSLIPVALRDALSVGSVSGLVCGLPGQLEEKGLYVPGRLNVYYLPVPGTGMTCEDDRNVIFMALNAKPETLAHEFGHALSLAGSWGHANPVPGLSPSNLMWVSDTQPRDHISLGQVLRMNLDETSVLNVNGVRSGPERRCPAEPPPLSIPDDCPPLYLDWGRP
jgi:hypothetical protein